MIRNTIHLKLLGFIELLELARPISFACKKYLNLKKDLNFFSRKNRKQERKNNLSSNCIINFYGRKHINKSYDSMQFLICT